MEFALQHSHRKWIQHAHSQVLDGHAKRGVALIPARTDTRAWQSCILREVREAPSADYGDGWRDVVIKSDAVRLVRFLPGRVHFGDGKQGPAPFPSALIVWER